MIHRNARMTPAGRRILVKRLLAGRRFALRGGNRADLRAPADKPLPCSRLGRSSGPQNQTKTCPHVTPAGVAADVLTQRLEHREGPMGLALRWGTSARTVSRTSGPCRHAAPMGRGHGDRARLRASRATDRHYEWDAPGDVIDIDVKKLGRITDRARSACGSFPRPCKPPQIA